MKPNSTRDCRSEGATEKERNMCTVRPNRIIRKVRMKHLCHTFFEYHQYFMGVVYVNVCVCMCLGTYVWNLIQKKHMPHFIAFPHIRINISLAWNVQECLLFVHHTHTHASTGKIKWKIFKATENEKVYRIPVNE